MYQVGRPSNIRQGSNWDSCTKAAFCLNDRTTGEFMEVRLDRNPINTGHMKAAFMLIAALVSFTAGYYTSAWRMQPAIEQTVASIRILEAQISAAGQEKELLDADLAAAQMVHEDLPTADNPTAVANQSSASRDASATVERSSTDLSFANYMDRVHEDFFKSVNMPSERQEALIALHMEFREERQGLVYEATLKIEGQLNETQQEILHAERAAQKLSHMDRLREFIGNDDDYADYVDYLDNFSTRRSVKQYNSLLTTPFNDDTKEAIISIVVEEKSRAQIPGSTSDFTAEQHATFMKEYVGKQEGFHAKILERTSSYLDAEQQDELEQLFQDEREQSALMARMIEIQTDEEVEEKDDEDSEDDE